MLSVVVAIVLAYVAVSLFGYVVHWSLHQPWTGDAHRRHLYHHTVLFPASSYSAPKYRDPGENSTVRIFAIASIPMILAPILLGAFGVISWWLVGLVIGEMLLFGWASDYIHDQFHLTRTWLNALPAFRKWNELHYIHHVDMSKNLSIFDYTLDRLFDTYQEPDIESIEGDTE